MCIQYKVGGILGDSCKKINFSFTGVVSKRNKRSDFLRYCTLVQYLFLFWNRFKSA